MTMRLLLFYSKRTGTPAATMPNPTSEEEIKANFDRLWQWCIRRQRNAVGAWLVRRTAFS